MALLTSLMQQAPGQQGQPPAPDASQQGSMEQLLPMILQMIMQPGQQPQPGGPGTDQGQPPQGQQGGGDPAQLMQMLQQMGLNIGH